MLARSKYIVDFFYLRPYSNLKVTTYKVYEIFGWSPAGDNLQDEYTVTKNVRLGGEGAAHGVLRRHVSTASR